MPIFLVAASVPDALALAVCSWVALLAQATIRTPAPTCRRGSRPSGPSRSGWSTSGADPAARPPEHGAARSPGAGRASFAPAGRASIAILWPAPRTIGRHTECLPGGRPSPLPPRRGSCAGSASGCPRLPAPTSISSTSPPARSSPEPIPRGRRGPAALPPPVPLAGGPGRGAVRVAAAGNRPCLLGRAGAGALTLAAQRYGRGLPVALLSAPFLNAVVLGQWSPLLTAAAVFPLLGWAWASKPSLGAALFAAYPSRRAALSGIAIVGLSLVVMPAWPLGLVGCPPPIDPAGADFEPGGFPSRWHCFAGARAKPACSSPSPACHRRSGSTSCCRSS